MGRGRERKKERKKEQEMRNNERPWGGAITAAGNLG